MAWPSRTESGLALGLLRHGQLSLAMACRLLVNSRRASRLHRRLISLGPGSGGSEMNGSEMTGWFRNLTPVGF
eukprot:11224640-Alexandrium_andersonii.AAC.1